MTDGARALLDGGLAILPTDTVYGIAAAAGSSRAARSSTGSSSGLRRSRWR